MTPAFTVTITADSPEQLHANLRAMLPDATVNEQLPFQDLLIRVAERADAEGYDMEVWKKGERHTAPAPSTTSEKKKEQARAKLRGELIESLAEATHATAAVKDEIEQAGEVITASGGPYELRKPGVEIEQPTEELPKPKKTRATKTGNGKAETADQIKARTVTKLQELYSAGQKAEVNKILAKFGDGVKTFSSIPADKFEEIAEAVAELG